VFTLAEPYAILDFQTFQHHTREQTNMVRGYWRPPYTVQYAHTLPYIYHLQQMLWYTMGWPLFLVAIAGIIVATTRMFIESIDKILRQEFLAKPLSSEIIPLTFLIVFFTATGYFQVKFPRYLLPLYPLAFMFAANLFGNTFKISTARPIPLTTPASTAILAERETETNTDGQATNPVVVQSPGGAGAE
jgi:hypothetical protein